ncbi:hypothetical protein V8C35DRAFT_97903 [Trichoderma chlorosporum]
MMASPVPVRSASIADGPLACFSQSHSQSCRLSPVRSSVSSTRVSAKRHCGRRQRISVPPTNDQSSCLTNARAKVFEIAQARPLFV